MISTCFTTPISSLVESTALSIQPLAHNRCPPKIAVFHGFSKHTHCGTVQKLFGIGHPNLKSNDKNCFRLLCSAGSWFWGEWWTKCKFHMEWPFYDLEPSKFLIYKQIFHRFRYKIVALTIVLIPSEICLSMVFISSRIKGTLSSNILYLKSRPNAQYSKIIS